MKKVNIYPLMSLALGVLALPLSASNHQHIPDAHSPSKTATLTPEEEEEEEEEEDDFYEILDRDQIDTSDIFAIPLDDSEVEDEEEIDQAEGKDVFHLPRHR